VRVDYPEPIRLEIDRFIDAVRRDEVSDDFLGLTREAVQLANLAEKSFAVGGTPIAVPDRVAAWHTGE
jgi:hypothetical protein